MIDVNFDFRNDSECGDPDNDSQKLYENHKILWNKILPNEKIFELEILMLGGKYGRIVLKNKLCANLSNDRMCPHFDGKYNLKCNDWLTNFEMEELKEKVRTIGGHILFPAHKKNGFTINQARGISKKICDRFDLTLECIRRLYLNETSPLYDTLLNYEDFFKLFVDFKNYIDFFMLQDFVNEKYEIQFSIPFDNFLRSPLPQNINEYKQYKNHTIELMNKRNKRIAEYYKMYCT